MTAQVAVGQWYEVVETPNALPVARGGMVEVVGLGDVLGYQVRSGGTTRGSWRFSPFLDSPLGPGAYGLHLVHETRGPMSMLAVRVARGDQRGHLAITERNHVFYNLRAEMSVRWAFGRYVTRAEAEDSLLRGIQRAEDHGYTLDAEPTPTRIAWPTTLDTRAWLARDMGAIIDAALTDAVLV